MKYYSKYYYFFAALVIILSSWTIYYTLPGPTSIYLAIFAIWILWHNNFLVAKSKVFYVFSFGVLIIWNFLPRGSSYEEVGLMSSLANMALLTALFIINNSDREKIFDRYLSTLTIIVVIGLIFHIFDIIGIRLLNPIFSNYITTSERLYVVYPTHSNIVVRGIETIRFSGIFDEPGYLGTILAFTLCIEKYDLKKNRNKALFLAGMFTLSGAFFALTIIYFGLTMVYLRKFKKWVISLIIGLFVITIIYIIIPDLFIEITDRLIFIEGAGLQDNRANIMSFKQYIENLQQLDTNTFFWGKGQLAVPEEHGITIIHVSWVHLVVRLGIIFFLYLLVILIISAIRAKNFNTIVFIVLFVLSMNHRPQIFNPIYFFLLSCGIFLIPFKEKNINKPDM